VNGTIREARDDDAAAIRAVLVDAFPTPAEADLVEGLERDGDVVLSLVHELGGVVVGHVLFSGMAIESDTPVRAAALAPLAVTSAMQGGGIRTTLVRAAIERLRETGFDVVFVLGQPPYYRRFGFDAALAQAYGSPYAGEHFMALALRDCAAAGGTAHHAPAFARLGVTE
jgi:putative acetyltransferase